MTCGPPGGGGDRDESPKEPPKEVTKVEDDGDDIPSRLKRIEPNEVVLRRDIRKLAVYFAQVGFNTGLYIKNPYSQDIRDKLDHVQVMRLVDKYNLKMNLDKKFKWISHPEPYTKLRIYHIALTYLETFIGTAAATSPVDFAEERFWRCAQNYDFWLGSRRTMKQLNGRSRRDVRDRHSSSRLLSVAVLPLLTRKEKNLIKVCALAIEVRKGTPDRGRFNHFMRECLRHVDEDKVGKAWPKLKQQLRRRFGIEEAEKELHPVDESVFLNFWADTSVKHAVIRFEDYVSKPVCIKHLEMKEPDKAQLGADLKLLAQHFCRLQAERSLKECQIYSIVSDKLDLRKVLALVQKYDIGYSPVINQFSIKKYEREKRLSIDGVAREHLRVFIDTAALSEGFDLDEEERFWRCANNLTFWQRQTKLTRKCKDQDRKCHLSPNRLLACGFYRLLTRDEPNLIELYCLRAPSEQYDYVKHNILYQIDKFDKVAEPVHRECRNQLRARYQVEEAERQLNPITRELFLKQAARLQQAEDTATYPRLEPLKEVRYEHAKYLREIEPDGLKLERELLQLAAHFNGLASMFLLDNHNQLRSLLDEQSKQAQPDVQIYKLAYKYRVIYSRVCNTPEQPKFLVRLHRLVDDHLRLFIDSAALANISNHSAEKRFWTCANNLSFFMKHSKELEQCEQTKRLFKEAPSRLVSIGTFRLVTSEQPKLLALSALRAAAERQDRRLTIFHFETLKKLIESTNEKLNAKCEQRIRELRSRYELEKAEAELEPVDANLFIERWNASIKYAEPARPAA